MATEAIVQPEAMTDVFSPEGVKGKIPFSKAPDYYKQGFKPAVRVTTPEGQGGWLPSDKVHDYLTTKGFHLGPPNQQFLEPKPDLAKDQEITDLVGHGLPTQEQLDTSQPAFVTQSAENIKKAAKSTGHVLKVGGGTLVKMALDPRGPGQALADEALQEQTEGGIPKSGEMIKQPLRELAGERQPGESVTLGFTGHAPEQQPLLTRTATAASSLMGGDPAGAREHFTRAATAEAQGNKELASEENQQGVADLTAVPLATVGTGRLIGSRAVRKVVTDAAKEAAAGVTEAIPKVAQPVISAGETALELPAKLRTLTNPVKAAETLPPEALATKATKPRNSIQNFKQQLSTALPDARRAADSLGVKVSNLDEANAAVMQAKRDVWQEYESSHLKPGQEQGLTVDGNKVADAMVKTINKRFATQNPDAAQAIMDLADQYRRPIPVAEAEDFLQSANNDLASYYAKNKVTQRTAALDPVKGHVVAEANTLRSELYKTLDGLSGSDAGALKKRYGALTTLEDVINRRINVAERQAPDSLIEQIGKVEAAKDVGKGVVKMITGQPMSGAADIVGAVRGVRASKLARQANDANFLIGKAFEKTEPTPAPRTLQQIIGGPANTSELPPAPQSRPIIDILHGPEPLVKQAPETSYTGPERRAPGRNLTSRISEFRKELQTETDPAKHAELEASIAREIAFERGEPSQPIPHENLPSLEETRRHFEEAPRIPDYQRGSVVNRTISDIIGNRPQEKIDLNAPKSKRKLPPDVTAKAELSGQTVPPKAPTFFSKAEQVAQEKLPNTVTSNQVIPTLQNAGVKAEELKWLGLDDYLKGKEKVSKADLLQHIRENNLQVQEQLRQSGRGKLPQYENYQLPGAQPQSYRELLLKLPEDQNAAAAARSVRVKELIARRDSLQLQIAKATVPELHVTEGPDSWIARDDRGLQWGEVGKGRVASKEEAQKYLDYYIRNRELESRNEAQRQLDNTERQIDLRMKETHDPNAFRSPHFDEPNVLAHVRFNDRISPDGKKTLFIEEVQSDWHQKGRREGYIDNEKVNHLERQIADLKKQAPTFAFTDKANAKRIATESALYRLEGELAEAKKGVPNAPFKSTWHELAMKRMLRYAAENGYDRLAWTTGEQQAARYDLSKQIDSIFYKQNEDGTYQLRLKPKGASARDAAIGEIGGRRLDAISVKDLPDYVGKEVAEKIASGHGEEKTVVGDSGYERQHVLSGIDLKVGGQGMKGFYDKILPDFMNKYGKKWGAKVTSGEINAGTDTDRVFIGQEPNEAKLQEVWKSSYGTLHTSVNNVISAMQDGQSFARAMDTYGTEELADKLGGKMQYGKPHKEPAHSIDITPAMRKEVIFKGQPIAKNQPPRSTISMMTGVSA